MATYNTRGDKHKGYRADKTTIYNKGFAWDSCIDKACKALIKSRPETQYENAFTKHLLNYFETATGNRTFTKEEITKDALLKGEVVEVDVELKTLRSGEEVFVIRKMVVRLLPRDDGECVVVVARVARDGVAYHTAWLNKATDNHTEGLDIRSFSYDFSRRFGFFNEDNGRLILFCPEDE